MVKNWRATLADKMDTLLVESMISSRIERESKYVWFVERNALKYYVLIEFGKFAQIPEFTISYKSAEINDEWGATSPSSRQVGSYIPSWKLARRLAISSEDTANIRDKTSKIHWIFSGTRDWNYITNQKQLDIVIKYILPDAVRKYEKIIS